MTRLERLELELEEAEQAYRNEVRKGKLIGLERFTSKIREIKEKIKECKYYSPQRLGNIVPKKDLISNNIYQKLLEIILAADYLYDTAFDCKVALKKLGIDSYQIFDMVKNIEDISSRIANTIIVDDVQELEDFVVNDDSFIEKCHNAAIEYIDSTLKFKKE